MLFYFYDFSDKEKSFQKRFIWLPLNYNNITIFQCFSNVLINCNKLYVI